MGDGVVFGVCSNHQTLPWMPLWLCLISLSKLAYLSMTDHSELPARPELDVILLDEQARDSTYILCPVDPTDKEIRTTWIRFKEGDRIPLSRNR